MPTEFDDIRDIARSALMPDFFAVRIEEENLFGHLKHLIDKIKLPSPLPPFEKIKQIAAASPNPVAFIDALKKADLWMTLREILAQVRVK